MTHEGPAVGDVVRPVRARVVRQEHALAHAAPLDELPGAGGGATAVSYTHLTLPTNREV